MIELAVAQGVSVLGKIGYDVWKRWFDGRPAGSGVVTHGSASYVPDPQVALAMMQSRGSTSTPALLRIGLHPGDDLSLDRVFQEQPVLVVIADVHRPDVDGLVTHGRVADLHEILLPPGRYDVSVFVFEDDAVETVSGVGWEGNLLIEDGFDVELSIAVQGVPIEFSEILIEDDFWTRMVFDSGEELNVSAAVISIGRAPSCDLVIDDLTISGEHALLGYTPQGWVIEDQNSTNGTYVNGARVASEYVNPGDVVTVGRTSFRFFF